MSEEKKTVTTFKPNGERILIRSLENSGDKKSAGGIIMPGQQGSDTSFLAEIVEMGTAFTPQYKEQLGLDVGDKVEVGKRVFDEVVLDGEKLTVAHIENIVGKYIVTEA